MRVNSAVEVGNQMVIVSALATSIFHSTVFDISVEIIFPPQ